MPVTYVRNPETGEFEQVGFGAQNTDTTLSQIGKPADAAAVGNALNNYATEAYVVSQVNTKVDRVDGKGLSTNDYTSAEKTKLAEIAEGANKYTLPIATSSVLGGVKTGNNITNTSGVISISSSDIKSALGYTPFDSSKCVPKSMGGAGRDLTEFPSNALIRNSGSGGSDLYYVQSDNGACFATEKDGYPHFGTLPVAQGGTGLTSTYEYGSVESLNSTTITSYEMRTYPYLGKTFIRLNIALGSALAAGGNRYVVMPSVPAKAYIALSCFNQSGCDVHAGIAGESGIYITNTGSTATAANLRLYISGWYTST